MSNRKIVNIGDKQFEYVNAIEIKELDAKYLIGKYVNSNKSVILHVDVNDDKLIVDTNKRSNVEKLVLNKYFMAHDGGEAFKKALSNKDIISFYYNMPNEIDAIFDDVSNKGEKQELKPIIISTTKVEIPSVELKIKEERYSQLNKLSDLIVGLQSEIDRYYDIINRLVNNG